MQLISEDLKIKQSETVYFADTRLKKRWDPNEMKRQTQRLKVAISEAKIRQRNGTSNGFIILATTNKDFIKLTDNWLKSISHLGLSHNITLIAEDKKSYLYYKRPRRRNKNNVFVVDAKTYEMNDDMFADVDNYQFLIRRRVFYIREALLSGLDVLLVDVDTVWLQDPLQMIWNTYDQYDLWVAQGKSFEVSEKQFVSPNFLYMKAVPSVLSLVYKWTNRVMFKLPKETDQNALNYVLDEAPKAGSMHVRVMELSTDHFPTGIELFNWDWFNLHIKDVMVAHANHVGNGLGREVTKIEKFKEFKLWFLDNHVTVLDELKQPMSVKQQIAAKIKKLTS